MMDVHNPTVVPVHFVKTSLSLVGQERRSSAASLGNVSNFPRAQARTQQPRLSLVVAPLLLLSQAPLLTAPLPRSAAL